MYNAPVLNSNDQYISEDAIADGNEKIGGIIYYSQEQDESTANIVGKYTHCLSHIMSSFHCFEIGHVAISIIDPLIDSNKLSQSQVITINKRILIIVFF